RRTPWIAVALTMVLTLITILLSSGSIGLVTTAIIMFQFGTGIIISTSLVLVSIIILCIILTITRRGSMTRGNNTRQD
ncbi:MAG: hypothetical protein ACRD93_06495, partial [Nitrososphaeraceae archaeon]